MKWRCSYCDPKGDRCEAEALFRLHFSTEHPFDHVDVCAEHLDEYEGFCRLEDLHGNKEMEVS